VTGRNETITAERRTTEEQLVREHLPLVQYAVSDMVGRIPRQVPRDDLVSAAMVGLAQAARSFDPERGISFERYASTRIRGALIDELRSRDWASRSVRFKARRMAVCVEDLTSELGRTPTTGEVATRMGVSAGTVDSLADDVHRAVVLNYDSVIAEGDAEDILPAETASPETVILDRERHAYLGDAIEALPERLRHVVVGYFFEERPMLELAEELGVSESRISQMRAEALGLLKEGINSQLDPEAQPAESTSTRVARRKSAYFAAVCSGSDWKARLTERSTAARLGVRAPATA
jgi:RNA polymerase sigma factor for flagellar operon FliA